MSAKQEAVSEAEALASVLSRILTPLVERIERLEGGKPQQQMSPDELHAKLMSELRGTNQDLEAFGLVEVVDGCRSDTGATFDAEIQYPPLRINGRIVGKDDKKPTVRVLRNYAWPVGLDKHTSEGGLVPDGMTMTELGPGGQQESDAFRQWKYDEFYKADAKRLIGKPLPAHMRQSAPVQPR
jgi:hypothetical protein